MSLSVSVRKDYENFRLDVRFEAGNEALALLGACAPSPQPPTPPAIAPTALLIALFLTFVARPAAVFAILSPFRCSVRQRLLVSWAGMRGAASIVFAIMVTVDPASTSNDIFHIVLTIVLFSILLQGSLIPPVARAAIDGIIRREQQRERAIEEIEAMKRDGRL